MPHENPHNLTNRGSPELERHGPERVILYDSYLEGVRTEVRLSGHTAITGANSSGKTSLIRLMQAFYGAEPQGVVHSGGSSQMRPFHAYYLPRLGSYVVFEYRTAQGLNLAVFTTQGTSSRVRVHLISGPADDLLFQDEQGSFLPKDDIARRAHAAGRVVITCPSLARYREILLGEAKVRGRTADEIRFSLLAGYPGTTRHSLDGVHAILSATLENKIDERLLRQLLLDQALRDIGISASGLHGVNFSAEEMGIWLGNFRGLRRMFDLAPKACATIEAGQALETLGLREAVVYAAMREKREVVRADLDREYKQRRHFEETLTMLESDHQAARTQYEKDVQEARGHVSYFEGEISRLDRRKRAFENDGIHDDIAQAALLDSKHHDLTQAQNQLEALTHESEEIDRPIDREIEGVKKDAERRVREARDQIDQLDERLRERREAMDDEQRRATAALEEAMSARSEALGDRETASSAAVAEAAQRVKLAQPEPDVVQRRDRARTDREQAVEKHVAAREQDQQARQARAEALNAQQLTEELLESSRREQAQREARQNDLADQLTREGTLLEFYRENLGEPDPTAAAVLSVGTELLYRKNLSPQLAEHPQDSFFGIKIDTTKLEAVDVDATGRAELDEIEARLATLEQVIREAEERSTSEKRRVRDTTVRCREAHENLAVSHSRQHAAGAALAEAEDAVAASLDRVQREAGEALATAQAERDQLKGERQAFHTWRDDERRQLRTSQDTQRESLKQEGKRERDTLQGLVIQIQQDGEREIARWQEIRQQRRAKSGVSHEAIHAARQRREDAEVASRQAERASRRVRDWEALLEEIAEKRPGLEREAEAARARRDEIENNWRDREATYKRNRADTERERDRAVNAVRRLESDQHRLKEEIGKPERLGDAANPDEATVTAKTALAVSALAREIIEIREAFDKQNKALEASLTPVVSAFRQETSRKLTEFRDEKSLTQLAAGSVGDRLQAAEAVREFFGDPAAWAADSRHFPPDSMGEQIENLIRSHLDPNWMEINSFLKDIEQLRKSVARQRRAIEDNYTSFLESLDSIDSISIIASFDPEKVSGYKAARSLMRAITSYLEHKEASGDQRLLPDDGVAKATERMIEYLQSRHHEQRQSLVDAVDMEFHVVRERGEEVTVARHGEALKTGFSSGIGLVVGASVLVGFLETMRRQLPVTIPWMLDEVLTLDRENACGLLEAMSRHELMLMTTSPDISSEVEPYFARSYALQKPEGATRSTERVFTEVKPGDRERDPFAVLDEADPAEPLPPTEESTHGAA